MRLFSALSLVIPSSFVIYFRRKAINAKEKGSQYIF